MSGAWQFVGGPGESAIKYPHVISFIIMSTVGTLSVLKASLLVS